LNPAVSPIRDVDVPIRVGSDIMRSVELARVDTPIAPRLDPVAILVGFSDAGIDIPVTDEDIPLRTKRYVRDLPEASVFGRQWRDRMF
jgi:hypothetical protein